MDDGIGNDGQVAGALGGRQRARQAGVIAADRAAAFAKRAGLASAATKLLVMRFGLAEIGGAPRNDLAARKRLLDCRLEHQLAIVEPESRQKFAIGQLRQALFRACDTDELLDVAIPRREIVIADRPVAAVAILGVGFEILRRKPVGLAPPHDRAPAQMIAANPLERLVFGRDVGVFVVLHPIMLGRAIDERVLLVLVMPRQIFLGHHAGIGHFPRHETIGVAFAVHHFLAALEHQDLQAPLAQFLGGDAAAHAGADYDCIKHCHNLRLSA